MRPQGRISFDIAGHLQVEIFFRVVPCQFLIVFLGIFSLLRFQPIIYQ